MGKTFAILTLLISSTFATAQNVFKSNSVYYCSDTLIGGEFDGLVLYRHYKFLNDSVVYISMPKKEKPSSENTLSLSTEMGYFGTVKMLKAGKVKIVCKVGTFHRSREIFVVGDQKLRLEKFVHEGTLFFQWRKAKVESTLVLLN